MTSDSTTYCSFLYSDLPPVAGFQVTSTDELSTGVLSSVNTTKTAEELTNILYRGIGNSEDPWIGCEGTHHQNIPQMLWGENGNSLYVQFKNNHGGILVFVRDSPDSCGEPQPPASAGEGWELVAKVPRTGNWLPIDCDLDETCV